MSNVESTAATSSKQGISRRTLLGAGGAAALSGSVARWTPGGSARASAQSEPVNGGRLQVGIISNPSSLDPSPSNGELYILRSLYDSLVTFDAELNPQPGLAESWEFPDDTTMVLNLRQGVKFHDGTDFDAEAVRINIEHTKDPATRTLFTSDFEPIDAVEVVDAHTARLRLKGAAAPLLASFAMQPGHMISPAALEEFGQDAGRNPVGTGPYIFQEWVEQDHVTVTRNPDYWDPSVVHLDEIIFRVVPEPTVRLTNLQAGDLDYVVSLGFKDVAPLRNDSSVQLFRTWAGADRFILNCGQPPFDNMALRQALQYALDREGLHRAVFFETGVIGYGPVHPPGSWAFDPDWKPFERSLDLAREKLAEGGMPDGFAFNVLVSDPINAQIAEIHQATFAEIGVQMTIERVDSAKRVADQIAMNYEASTSTWQTTLDPSPALYTPYHTNGSGNYLGYSNERVDELLEQAIATYDTELRRTLYREVDQILAEEAPCPIPYHRARIDAASAAVQGIQSRADPQFEVRNVWLSQ